MTLSLVVMVGLASSLYPAPIPHTFRPSTTDPAITQFDFFHRAFIDPAVSPRNQLLVFLPGTGGTPVVYQEYLKNAATLGYHALGLTYVNPVGINELCNTNDPANPDCHEQTRLEVIDGTDRSPLVTVDRTDSIENRLIKALEYLHAGFPAEGWNQFLSGQTILWDRIAVAGHSQGAGHAVLIARDHLVARCCNFAGLDWWSGGPQFAPWQNQPFLTPVDRIYILGHQRDEKVNFALLQPYSNLLDTTRYGEFVTPELETDSAFRGRHFLATDLEPVRPLPDGRYHGAMITDLDTPFEADGVTPVLKPAWDHMLLSPTPPVRLELDPAELRVYFSPGTLHQSGDLQGWTPLLSATSPHVLPAPLSPPRGFFLLDP